MDPLVYELIRSVRMRAGGCSGRVLSHDRVLFHGEPRRRTTRGHSPVRWIQERCRLLEPRGRLLPAAHARMDLDVLRRALQVT